MIGYIHNYTYIILLMISRGVSKGDRNYAKSFVKRNVRLSKGK